MVDLESIKAYYYESAAWNQITGIISYPTISKRMDNFSLCSITIHDFEGALHASWSTRDFTEIKIEDASENILFQGYLKGKTFMENGMILNLVGFANVLEWTPFTHNYILASGLVKSVAFDLFTPPLAIAATNAPVAATWASPYYYVLSNADEKVYKYNLDFTYTGTSYDISGDVTNPTGICWNGEYFFIVSQNDDKVYIYNTAFALQDSADVSQGALVHPMGICWDGQYLYIGQTDQVVYKYDSDLVYTDVSFDVSGDVSTISGFCFGVESFYIVDHNVETVFQFDSSFTVVDSFDISATNDVYGIGWDGSYFILIDAVGEQCYLYLSDFSAYSDNNVVELKQDDEDGGYPDFAWSDNQWIYNRNLGLLIKENTQGILTEDYPVTAVDPHDYLDKTGTLASVLTPNDGNVYKLIEGIGTLDAYLDCSLEGANIADTYTLKTITITYNFGSHLDPAYPWLPNESTTYLQIKKGTTWVNIAQVYNYANNIFFGNDVSTSDTITLRSDLSDYLDKTGANYDSLKGIRLKIVGYENTGVSYFYLDYLHSAVSYHVNDISPIMSKIDDNGASWVMCSDQDFSTNGVQAGDTFQIGENTLKILADLQARMLLNIQVNSTLTKYMARKFEGNNGLEVLQSIMQLEGLHWTEDHANKKIILAKSADFEDSGISLSATDYERDWSYEDECNHFKGVKVYGNASLGIQATAEDIDSTSLMWKQITDDTIMTLADAQSVADTQLLELKEKRPSLKLSVWDDDGTYSVLAPMTTADITLSRPTIAEVAYPLRRVDISRSGEHLKYTVYGGLGSTPPEEKLANHIRKIEGMVHRSFTDRLVNTPLGAGASLTPDDIAGLDTYILSLLSTNAAVSIEWRTDDLAAWDFTHADLTINSAWHELDLDNYCTVPAGTIAALATVVIKDNSTSQYIYFRSTSQANSVQVSRAETRVANVYDPATLLIPIDADHKVDYVAITGLAEIYCIIIAWVKVVE
jgi:hypothetical protein